MSIHPNVCSLQYFLNRRLFARIAFDIPRIIWVDPRSISHISYEWRLSSRRRAKRLCRSLAMFFPSVCVDKILKPLLWLWEPMCIPRLPPLERLDDNKVYQLLADIYFHRGRLGATKMYEGLATRLNESGPFSVKGWRISDASDVLQYIEGYHLGLIRSLRTNGFCLGLGSDVPGVLLDANGSLVKGDSGEHRFAYARIMNLHSVPVQINYIHCDWFRSVSHATLADRQLVEAALMAVEQSHRP